MSDQDLSTVLKETIRNIPDYPKKGIIFRDITTLLGNAEVFQLTIDCIVSSYTKKEIDKIAGIEARGFILGGVMSYKLQAGFIPIRKKGKLPYKSVSIAYSLEYGLDEMEMHYDALKPGEKVLLVDDLLATGGTAVAAVQLLQKIKADVVAACFIVNLPILGGEKKLNDLGIEVQTLVSF